MFAERLKSLRTEAGLTQEELADELKVSRSALSLYELGRRQPDYETLVKICSYFNVTADYLINEEVTVPVGPAHLSEDEVCVINFLRNRGEQYFNARELLLDGGILEKLGINDKMQKLMNRFSRMTPDDQEKVMEYAEMVLKFEKN